jgi:hypothetical protein
MTPSSDLLILEVNDLDLSTDSLVRPVRQNEAKMGVHPLWISRPICKAISHVRTWWTRSSG